MQEPKVKPSNYLFCQTISPQPRYVQFICFSFSQYDYFYDTILKILS